VFPFSVKILIPFLRGKTRSGQFWFVPQLRRLICDFSQRRQLKWGL